MRYVWPVVEPHPGQSAVHGPRYIAGALVCAAANNIILIAGDLAGLPDTAGVLLTWLLGGTLGYAWHCRITFRAAPSWRAYGQFMSGLALAIPLAFGVLWLFRGLAGWPMWVAAPLATIVLLAYNYCNARIAILRQRRRPRAAT